MGAVGELTDCSNRSAAGGGGGGVGGVFRVW